MLQNLSDNVILSRLQRLTRREQTSTLVVLLHLNEIERRELHLALGYSSMFAFCTRRLGYTESDAGRRIAAARCIMRFPEVCGLLERNAVTIATLARVASLLTEENRSALLARIQGRTQDEVEAIVAQMRPRAAAPRDRVRVIALHPAPAPPPAPLLETAPAPPHRAAPAEAKTTAGGSHTAAEAAHSPADEKHPCETRNDSHDESECKDRPEVRVAFSFTAGTAFKSRFDQIRALAAHRLPANASCEDVFGLLMDEFLRREDPVQRAKRRASRTPKPPAESANPRHIATAVRDELFQRDEGGCAFVGRDGGRCGSTHLLQVDHIRPVAMGGTGVRDNLRLLCAHHNRFEARRMMGSRISRGRADAD